MLKWIKICGSIPDLYIYIENFLGSNNFKSLKKLKIDNNDLEILSKLLSNENIQKHLEVIIINNNNISIEHSEMIAKLENPIQLTLKKVRFGDRTSLLKKFR
ncbi:hypothetical protein EQH57_0005 [Dictyocoela roeselum]|nr:hypothetical protein EQH57_0005 [Dictyocoela roeselum]